MKFPKFPYVPYLRAAGFLNGYEDRKFELSPAATDKEIVILFSRSREHLDLTLTTVNAVTVEARVVNKAASFTTFAIVVVPARLVHATPAFVELLRRLLT